MIVDKGDQAAGWLTVTGSSGGWTVAVRDFWESFPKALRVSPAGVIEIGLFPDEFGPEDYGINLRAGEHKTHEVLLSPLVAGGELPGFTGETFREPLFARAAPQWYVDSGGFPFLSARNYADWPDYEQYVDYQLDTAPTYREDMDWFPNLLAAIESTDFYGIFDYGDVPLDYEGRYVSPMNLKYHMDYGMWMQWARGEDRRWFRLAEAEGRHIADIDILHNLHSPRHWGDGIMFGHSAHDELGFTNPHRNWNSGSPDTAYGILGMLTTYYLTGYEKAYEAALELADCIEWRLHNDSYLRSYLPGDCSGEGWALYADGLYDSNTRPAANSLLIMVEAYWATGDPRYLTVAEALVRWSRASDQRYVDGPTGEDCHVAPQWLALQGLALGRYVEALDAADLPDTHDAAGSLVGYADFLRTYAWLELSPVDTGSRGAYPYHWWMDGRAESDVPVICNWLVAGADLMAYAHRYSGEADYLERAEALFRAGTRDPWFEGDASTYSSTKETANSVFFGHVFLNEWAAQGSGSVNR